MSKPGREIELKFLLDRAGADAVLAALPPGDEPPAVKSLTATYYDTADHALSRAGFGLRVRKSDRVRTQTLKSAVGGDGGRDEWEWLVPTDAPDLGLLAETPAPADVDTVLESQFTVRSRRTIRMVEEAGAWIELVIDDAEVAAGDRRERFLELELELKAGPVEALFGLARGLLEVAPLRLSFVTKAERGYRLAAGPDVRRRPRYQGPKLSPDAIAAEAFRALGGAGLAHLAASAESLRGRGGPEGVHQLRVAVRRLRAALSTFKPLLDKAGRKTAKAELRWLAGELDEARNLDVFIADAWLPAAPDHGDLPGMADFGKALLDAQARAYARAAAALDSARFRALTLDIAAWLQTPWAGDSGETVSAAGFAARALEKQRAKILKTGRKLAALDAEGRHRLRIRTKALRYAAEDLAALFPEHPRRAERFIAALKSLQEALGAANDLAFGERLAMDVAQVAGSPEAAFAAGRLAGERAGDEAALLQASEKAFAAFADLRPFW